jgi:asparagine synthetase A
MDKHMVNAANIFATGVIAPLQAWRRRTLKETHLSNNQGLGVPEDILCNPTEDLVSLIEPVRARRY